MPARSAEPLTLLLTDIVGSTRLWEAEPVAMQSALHRHDRLAAEIVPMYEGELVKSRGEGDSLFIVFKNASKAVTAACVLQTAFTREAWPAEAPLKVRMALHTGETIVRGRDYYGPVVNRCAR